MRIRGEMLVGLEKEPHFLVPGCFGIRKSQGKLSGYLLGAQNGGEDNALPVAVGAQENGQIWREFEKLNSSRLTLRCQWDHSGHISSRELDI